MPVASTGQLGAGHRGAERDHALSVRGEAHRDAAPGRIVGGQRGRPTATEAPAGEHPGRVKRPRRGAEAEPRAGRLAEDVASMAVAHAERPRAIRGVGTQ